MASRAVPVPQHPNGAGDPGLLKPSGHEGDGAGPGEAECCGADRFATGQPGRRSKSLTPEQVDDVLIKTAPDRLHPYLVVSLLTGARTEELPALRWEHVHLDGRPNAVQSAPPHFEVWRSVREGGDTKTRKSRRTLALPGRAVQALRKQRAQQTADRLAAGQSVAGDRPGVHDRTGHPA